MSDDDDLDGGGEQPELPERQPHDGPTIAVEEEMKRSYLDYAMSVIVSRAIPDLRDGLKPVHRRILYAMHESGNTWDKPYRKSARPVGEVMGKYHPHGDSAIYDALVRMAQDFSMRLPLLDGQGNFGSMDGDNAAAMRYTEVRMAKSAEMLLADIDKDTVDFQANYDGKDREPVVLPARYPNLLVNGGSGIAVGMATNIPPHNLGEVIDATLALIENPEMTIPELMEFIPAPDFPTGALILGQSGARKAYMTGRGSVIIRAKTRIEEIRKDRFAIIVDEVPYQVNKATMIEKIAELARDKKIEGIAHVQDESDRLGIRVVIELKRDATPDVVLNQLYRFTPLQQTFSMMNIALVNRRPRTLGLREMIDCHLRHRRDVVRRRASHLLREAKKRAHLLEGMIYAVCDIDEVIRLIRASRTREEAIQALVKRRFRIAADHPYAGQIPQRLIDYAARFEALGGVSLSRVQAETIGAMRLIQLVGLEIEKLAGDYTGLVAQIEEFEANPKTLDYDLEELRQWNCLDAWGSLSEEQARAHYSATIRRERNYVIVPPAVLELIEKYC